MSLQKRVRRIGCLKKSLQAAREEQQRKYQVLVGDPKMAAEPLNINYSLRFAMPEVFDSIRYRGRNLGIRPSGNFGELIDFDSAVKKFYKRINLKDPRSR